MEKTTLVVPETQRVIRDLIGLQIIKAWTNLKTAYLQPFEVNMRNWTALAASTAVFFSSLFGGYANADLPAQSTPAQQKKVSYLYVIKSPVGKLSQLDENNYQLTIPMKDIKTVLAFSDRPERIVKHLTPAEFVKMVDSGKNSFIQDPPNMSVSIGSHTPAVFEVLQVVRSDGQVIYHLRLLDNQVSPSAASGLTTLYIDVSFSGGGDFNIT